MTRLRPGGPAFRFGRRAQPCNLVAHPARDRLRHLIEAGYAGSTAPASTCG